MMVQKFLIALLIVYLACFIASLLKFAEREQLDVFNSVLSLFMPLLLLRLMIKVSVFSWEHDFYHLPPTKKFFSAVKLVLFQIRFTPSIHTRFINRICRCQKENSETKVTVIYFTTAEKTMADVRGMIYSNAKFA